MTSLYTHATGCGSIGADARSGCTADDAVARLAEETGHPERLAALAVDISNPKSVEVAAWTLGLDFAGKLGGLINNAAVSVVCRAALN